MRDDDILSETAVRRVLERAARLDTDLGRTLSVAQLRDVAREAGLSEASVQLALAEMASTAAPPRVRSWKERAVNGILRFAAVISAAAVTALCLKPIALLIHRVTGDLNTRDYVTVATLIVASSVGLLVARRLRSRIGQVVTSGLGLAMLIDLSFELSGFMVNGREAKFAEITAALLGVGLGVVLAAARNRRGQAEPDAPREVASPEAPRRTPTRFWRVWFGRRAYDRPVPAI